MKKNVELKILKQEDIELIRTWRNSKEVSQYMYTESLISKEQQLNWFNSINNNPNSRYWVIEYNNNKIGLASVTGIDPILNSCYWAFYLGDTSIRGEGIGSKVEYSIIEKVFDELNLNKLRCEVFVTNKNVIRMHEKFGFRREAYYREHCIKNEVKLDVVGLALLKTDWVINKDFFQKEIFKK